MIKLKVEGMSKTRAMLSGVEKQVRHAQVVALNRAAFAGAQAVKKEISSRFDRPTPWVVGGVRYTKATKSARLVGGIAIGSASVMTSTIDLEQWGNKQGVSVERILDAEIKGGQRRNKRHEAALQREGILPSGMYIVPGDAAVIDQYGNMSSGQIVQIISYFKAFGEQGYQANMSQRRRDSLARDKRKTGEKGFVYFVLHRRHGKLLPGIYQRFSFAFGSAVKPVMIFVRKSAYKPRLDFYGVGERAAMKEFDEQFPIAFKQAMDTAK